MPETSNNKKDLALYLAFVLLFIGIAFLFFPYKILNGLELFGYYINIKDFGDLGSYIGGVTTPFLSIAAFILLYRTYTSQKEELNETKTILKAQNETIEKQQFESTFFKMLDLYNSVVSDLKITITTRGTIDGTKEKTWQGKGFFTLIINELRSNYNEKQSDNLKETIKVQSAYSKLAKKYEVSLDHYYRNLYQIIHFVDTSNVKDKQLYINILKAQHSSNQLLIVFYLGLSTFGLKKLKPLIEKYSLLEHILGRELLDIRHCIEYETSAFGEKNESIINNLKTFKLD